jgi:hypothetical protein
MDYTPNVKAIEELSERIAEQLKGIVQRIGEEAREEKRTLEWFEKQAVMMLKGVGQTLVAGLCELYVRDYPATEIRCECGGVAVYQRQRAGQTKTLLGEIVVDASVLLVCNVPAWALSPGWPVGVWCRWREQWLERVDGVDGRRVCL